MNENQINSFFETIQKVSINSGYFININRRKKMTAEDFDNNPLLYPYSKNSKILNWEVDSFFDNTSNFLDYRKDSWIIREECVIK